MPSESSLAFVRAVLAGELDRVSQLLESGVDPNTPIDAKRTRRESQRDLTPDGFRALHVAAYEDDGPLCELLLRHGADPWMTTRFDTVAIGLAAEWNSPAFIHSMVNFGIGLDPPAPNRSSPLAAAAGRGHGNIVELLLAAGARKGLSAALGLSCSFKGNAEILTMLLDAGAEIEAPQPDRWTPRVAAVYSRHFDCLEILRERTTPTTLHDAAIDGDLPRLTELLADGADVDEQAPHKITPLVVGAVLGHIDVARALLDAGAKVRHHCVIGTALEQALRGNHLELADLLHERGAQVSQNL